MVDDEIITLRITRKFLAQNGHSIDITDSSSKAIELLSDNEYDLVLVDITMPTISGFDLVKMMQSFNIDTPVIFLSNTDSLWTIEEARNLGGKKFVSKEKDFHQLPEIIDEVLKLIIKN